MKLSNEGFSSLQDERIDLKKNAKPAPPPALKAEFKDSTTKQSAEDVAEIIFTALKNNNNPAPNHGLQVPMQLLNHCDCSATDLHWQVILQNSSPLNPFKSQSLEQLIEVVIHCAFSRSLFDHITPTRDCTGRPPPPPRPAPTHARALTPAARRAADHGAGQVQHPPGPLRRLQGGLGQAGRRRRRRADLPRRRQGPPAPRARPPRACPSSARAPAPPHDRPRHRTIARATARSPAQAALLPPRGSLAPPNCAARCCAVASGRVRAGARRRRRRSAAAPPAARDPPPTPAAARDPRPPPAHGARGCAASPRRDARRR